MFSKYVRIILIAVSLIQSICLLAKQNELQKRPAHVNWNEVRRALDSLVKNPAHEEKVALLATLPRDRTNRSDGDKQSALELIRENFDFFKKWIWLGDRKVAESAFRLLNFSDGIVSEGLAGILSELANHNPNLYLELILEYKNSHFITNRGYPIIFPANIEEPAESIYLSLVARKGKLQRADGDKYAEIIDECVLLIDGKLASGFYLRYRYPKAPEVVDFLDVLRCLRSEERETELDFNKVHLRNIKEIMSHISGRGVDFLDRINNSSSRLRYEDIEKELLGRQGISFIVLACLGDFFYHRAVRCSIEDQNCQVALTIGPFYKLVFVRESEAVRLISCERRKLWDENGASER
jgi:hypothetical protein